MKHQRPVILCVDDDDTILHTMRSLLTLEFNDIYSIELANDGKEALELIDELKSEGINVKLVITDWLMPNMKGDELLMQVHALYPEIAKIMVTGYADEDRVERVMREANLEARFEKPWDNERFLRTVRTVLTDTTV